MKKCIACFLFSISLYAHPSAPTIISGEASFSQLEQLFQISVSDEAILHWKEFSIQKGEITQFIQPSEQSWVLNRVIDQNPTEILGTLQSNGQVFLINPFGMVFHEQSQIDTAGFLASTLDVLDENGFKKGEVEFIGNSQNALVHKGIIQAHNGNVVLLGSQVENHGEIHGIECWIAAAQEVLFKPFGEDKIWIRPQADPIKNDEAIGIWNTGTISCAQAQLLAEGNPYGFAIKQEGEIDALGIESINGKIYLIAEEGRISHTGSINADNLDSTGGEIHILGKEIGILDKALIDISGTNGGGTLLIGGDYQGNNSEIPNGELTFVEKNVLIKANAQTEGDGGKVILWGDQATYFYGTIDATGGESSGDGGFVEVSGKYLDFQGFVDRRAPHGKAGELLLDPNDFEIIAGAAISAGVTFGGACGATTYCVTGAGVSPATIGNSHLTTNLNAGNVTITTSGGAFDKGETGNITVSAPVDGTVVPAYSSTFNFTMIADGNIINTASIVDNTAVAGGTLSLQAPNGNIIVGGGATSGEFTTSGPLDVLTQNLLLNGGTAGGANGILRGNNATIQVAQDLLMTANVGAPRLGGGGMIINVGRDLIAQSNGPGTVIGAGIPGSGSITLSVGRNMEILGPALWPAARDWDISVGGFLNIIGNAAGNGSIAARQIGGPPFGRMNVTVAGDITLNAQLGGGHGLGSGSDMTIRTAGSLIIGANAGLNLVQGIAVERADMLVIADRDIIINSQLPGFGIINNTPGGEITFVVDNAFPTPFGMGPGRFILSAAPSPTLSFINTGGPVRFFTSQRSQNVIARGIFNFTTGLEASPPFTPGPIFVDSAQEQWGFYYPNSFFGGQTVTVFYKEGISILVTAAQVGFVASAEMFRDLHPFDEWILWFMKFNTQYENGREGTGDFSTFDIIKDASYIIPRREIPWDRIYLPKEE